MMAGDRAFKSIGVCGGGKMALSFFNHMARFDFELVFYARNPRKLEQVKGSCKKRRPDAIFTDNMEALGDTDIIFEFIAEDRESKRELINRILAARRNPAQIIATGASSLTPGKIFPEAVQSLVGVHFIYPVQYIKTAEVVYKSRTQGETAARIRDLLLYTGKAPVLLDEGIGPVSTRVLIDFQNEAFRLSREQGLLPREVDGLVAEEGYAMAPFELTDNVGFDVTRGTIRGHFEGREELQRFEDFKRYLEQSMQEGWMGRKSGRGFFNYGKAGREESGVSIDPETRLKAAERLKAAYLNSCLKLLDGCWLDSEKLDGIFCELSPAGTGPVALALEYGMEKLLNTLEKLAPLYGAHFKPPGILEYAVRNKAGRDELDRQIRLFNLGGERPHWHNKNFGGAV